MSWTRESRKAIVWAALRARHYCSSVVKCCYGGALRTTPRSSYVSRSFPTEDFGCFLGLSYGWIVGFEPRPLGRSWRPLGTAGGAPSRRAFTGVTCTFHIAVSAYSARPRRARLFCPCSSAALGWEDVAITPAGGYMTSGPQWPAAR